MGVTIWKVEHKEIAYLGGDDNDIDAILGSFDTLDDYENTIIYVITEDSINRIPDDVKERNREVIEALLKVLKEEGGAIWVQVG